MNKEKKENTPNIIRNTYGQVISMSFVMENKGIKMRTVNEQEFKRLKYIVLNNWDKIRENERVDLQPTKNGEFVVLLLGKVVGKHNSWTRANAERQALKWIIERKQN